MIIHDGFYLSGFTRIDKGEEGAVFIHYAPPEENKHKPTIETEWLKYGGVFSDSYIISVPKYVPTACAIVKRSSRSRYSATAFDEKRIEIFHSDTLDGLRRAVADFFGV